MQFWVKVLQVLLAIALWFGIMWIGLRLKERPYDKEHTTQENNLFLAK